MAEDIKDLVIKTKLGDIIIKTEGIDLHVTMPKFGHLEIYHATTGIDIMHRDAGEARSIPVPQACKAATFKMSLETVYR